MVELEKLKRDLINKDYNIAKQIELVTKNIKKEMNFYKNK